jgi:hypothetical protein
MSNVTDRLMEWGWLAFVAVFGFIWRMHDRVARLEMHQEYTHRKLNAIDSTLERIEQKCDTLLQHRGSYGD